MSLILILGAAYILFKMGKAWTEFTNDKKHMAVKINYLNEDIKYEPSNPINYLRRATVFQISQNYPEAFKDYEQALDLIKKKEIGYNKGNIVTIDEELIDGVYLNIQFLRKPFFWSSGEIKDFSNSWFHYFLLQRFGNTRTYF